MDTAFIIPAVKKNVAFYDDLMKKMVGDPLIQRAIKKAEAITEKKNIYINIFVLPIACQFPPTELCSGAFELAWPAVYP